MANDSAGYVQEGFHDPSKCTVCTPSLIKPDPDVNADCSPDEGMPRMPEDHTHNSDGPSLPTRPDHYDFGNGVQSIDIIFQALDQDEFIGFCKGNVLKYCHRANFKYKDHDDDLRKAAVYAKWMVEAIDGKAPSHD